MNCYRSKAAAGATGAVFAVSGAAVAIGRCLAADQCWSYNATFDIGIVTVFNICTLIASAFVSIFFKFSSGLSVSLRESFAFVSILSMVKRIALLFSLALTDLFISSLLSLD